MQQGDMVIKRNSLNTMILKEVYKIKMARVHLMECEVEEIILMAVNGLRLDLERENRQ